MGYQKEDIKQSWEAHRETMRDTFQEYRERGMTEEIFVHESRRSFEAGANAMLDAFSAELLRQDLERAREESETENIVPFAGVPAMAAAAEVGA